MLKKLTQKQQDTILECAIEEFGENGPSRAAVSSIARRAGVSVGVIYKYYENKEALFDHCLRHSVGILTQEMEKAVSDTDDLMGACEKLIRSCISFSREHPAYIQMYHAITHTQEGAERYAQAIESLTASTYTAILEKAQQGGEIRQDLSPSLAAMFFDNLLMMLQFSYGCAYYRERMKLYCRNTEEADEQMTAGLMAFIGGALKG